MQKISQFILPLAIVIAAVIIGGVFLYDNLSKNPANNPQKENTLSSQEVADKIIKYVNEILLNGKATASLTEVTEEGGLYRIKFEVAGQKVDSYATREGKLFFPEAIDLTAAEAPAQETGEAIGGFSISSDEICKENGKPVVYFFGSQSCPHCVWEHPIVEKVMAKFASDISFHNNMDNQNDMDVFNKYSTGGIPALILGCKYFRVGSGESDGKETEEKNLTALTCKLTDNKPVEVCSQVQDLINQIL